MKAIYHHNFVGWKLNKDEMSAIATRSRTNAVTYEAPAIRVAGWGLFPLLCLSNSLALLLIALAYTASRNSVDWAQGLFWLSLLVLFVPTAVRIVSPSIARKERIALVVLLGCSLYLVKVLQSPFDFTF